MYSAGDTRALPRVGFPIRKFRDQRLVSTSPGLIAAAHVLHRLSAPRHPPCALVLLIEKNTCVCRYGVFKVRASSARPTRNAARRGRSLKTQQRELVFPRSHSKRSLRGDGTNIEVDVVLGGPDTGRSEDHRRAGYTLGVSAPRFPRKEVIQPQLPLRLPCYDFTPIIDPTFDGSLPCGLGHRLRVLPTFVV
jgi:hypothetical protein